MRTIFLILVMVSIASVKGANDGKDLFILSGQSNMARLDPQISFIPSLENALGKDKFITVKYAIGGQPIIKWIKKANDPTNNQDAEKLYTPLAKAIKKAIDGEKIKSVTFLWMQGEKDTRNLDDIKRYEERFNILLEQLKEDFNFKEINVVIGRLSDAGVNNKTSWNAMRQIQEKLVNTLPKARIVNTDDLNDGLQNNNGQTREVQNDIHYSIEGYKIFGERLSSAALQMLDK